MLCCVGVKSLLFFWRGIAHHFCQRMIKQFWEIQYYRTELWGKCFFKIILWGCVKGDFFLFCGTVCGLSIDWRGLISLFFVDCYWTILCVVWYHHLSIFVRSHFALLSWWMVMYRTVWSHYFLGSVISLSFEEYDLTIFLRGRSLNLLWMMISLSFEVYDLTIFLCGRSLNLLWKMISQSFQLDL